jgi:uncharacterized membrane protein
VIPDILFLKWLHILGATLLFGTGLGTAFHGLAAHLSGNGQARAVAWRNVVRADWLFTTPAVILQPLTGILLASSEGWTYTTPWLLASIALYLVAGACWLPVVWLQLRLCRLAEGAAAKKTPLSPLYDRYFRLWFALGWPAFAAVIGIFWLMIVKPGF